MPLFERASNISITSSLFSENNYGDVYLGEKTNADALCTIRRTAEQDSAFNEYSPARGTLKLPTFSKELLLNISDFSSDIVSRPISGSCCFDLAWRLGLLPDQPNAGFMEYGNNTPVSDVVMRGACCCGRISRHGLVYLFSRFFQHASTQEAGSGGTIITINTTIGRFKCYEIDDRTFVHFDGSTRSTPVTELVMNQDLDHILLAARGKYLALYGEFLSRMEWTAIDEERIPRSASANFFCLPNAIMYMSKEQITTWRLLRDFGQMTLTYVLQYVDTLEEPEGFCSLVKKLQNTADIDPSSIKPATPPEMLAYSLLLCRIMSEKDIDTYEHEIFSNFAKRCMYDLLTAHQHYRGPRVQGGKLYTTSQDRFLKMFRNYRGQETGARTSVRGRLDIEEMIQLELNSLIHKNAKNIALVVFQAFIGITVHWNASRMLSRAREVPVDLIRFLLAEDNYIYLG